MKMDKALTCPFPNGSNFPWKNRYSINLSGKVSFERTDGALLEHRHRKAKSLLYQVVLCCRRNATFDFCLGVVR